MNSAVAAAPAASPQASGVQRPALRRPAIAAAPVRAAKPWNRLGGGADHHASYGVIVATTASAPARTAPTRSVRSSQKTPTRLARNGNHQCTASPRCAPRAR
jgi:hypothetical protein